nr:protein heat-stress-associated 32 [Tanacetum cinerariifolium]
NSTSTTKGGGDSNDIKSSYDEIDEEDKVFRSDSTEIDNDAYPVKFQGDIDVLIRRAERCLKARADMISIDAEGVWRFAESVRSDIIAKVIGRLGLEKTMFEGSNSKTAEWLTFSFIIPKCWTWSVFEEVTWEKITDLFLTLHFFYCKEKLYDLTISGEVVNVKYLTD